MTFGMNLDTYNSTPSMSLSINGVTGEEKIADYWKIIMKVFSIMYHVITWMIHTINTYRRQTQ